MCPKTEWWSLSRLQICQTDWSHRPKVLLHYEMTMWALYRLLDVWNISILLWINSGFKLFDAPFFLSNELYESFQPLPPGLTTLEAGFCWHVILVQLDSWLLGAQACLGQSSQAQAGHSSRHWGRNPWKPWKIGTWCSNFEHPVWKSLPLETPAQGSMGEWGRYLWRLGGENGGESQLEVQIQNF